MNEIMAIAGGTWRRILRMRVVYFLILCVLILIGSAINYDVLSMQEHKPLMIDVSLVLNTIAAILVAVSMTFEIPKELREGVASTLLTKPLGRTQYLVGKLVGTIITGVIVTGIIAIGFFIIFNLSFNESIGHQMLQAHLLVIASIIPMASIAVLFSVILPEMLTPIITAIVIWFSYSTSQIGNLKVLYGGILPDLDLFNLKAYAVYGDKMDGVYIILAIAWGVVFCVFATSLASLIFGYKDLK
jgi:ABC-type transport system involved in multi-copper enzyme maturation permease subunit